MAIATLIIEDVDIRIGEVKVSTNIEGSLVDDGQMTAAEVMLRTLVAELQNPAFRVKMWATVEQMTAGTEAKIANSEYKPENVE